MDQQNWQDALSVLTSYASGGASLRAAREAAAQLAGADVSVELLQRSGAGKLVCELSSSGGAQDAQLADACAALYRAWRSAVVRELARQAAAGGELTAAADRGAAGGSSSHGAAAAPKRKGGGGGGCAASATAAAAAAAAAAATAAAGDRGCAGAEGQRRPAKRSRAGQLGGGGGGGGGGSSDGVPVLVTTACMEAAMQAAPRGSPGSRCVLAHSRKLRLDLPSSFTGRYGAFPDALHYRAKTWMLLQDQCNTAFIFAYEFGSGKTTGPNAGTVYLKMVDSVTFPALWRPSHHAALQAYIVHCQSLGYRRFYVWANSQTMAAEQGVFYAYPDKPAGASQHSLAQLCGWYDGLARKVLAATRRTATAVRLEKWSARTPLREVPCFGLGKSWPFTPHFGEGAGAAEIEAAEQLASAAMLKHGHSVFVLHLQGPAAEATRLAGRGEAVAVRSAREENEARGKTVCARPQELVSFCCRHGLSFASEELARQATRAILHAVAAPAGKLDDGCCRTCNVCNRYINAALDPFKHCAHADPHVRDSGEFDVCAACDVREPWHLQNHLKAKPGHVVFAKGWRKFSCTLPKGLCGCHAPKRQL